MAGISASSAFLLHQDERADDDGPQGRVGGLPVQRLLVGDLGDFAVGHPLRDTGLVVVRDAHGHFDQVQLIGDPDDVALGEMLFQLAPGQAGRFAVHFEAQFGVFFGLVCMRNINVR